MEYTILMPRKIVFGWGRRSEAGELACPLGRRAWIVCGSRTLQRQGLIAELQERLDASGVASELLATVTREPEVEDVDKAVADLLEAGVRDGDFVLGIGGGAGLDTAKAVAALATNRHGKSVRDFLEGVGVGLTIDHDPLPMLAMPTTAGTGTEATKNAVISSYDPPFKKSLRSERMVPDVVLVDPELTVSCPPSVTAQSGMDAITQLIESRVTRRATRYSKILCGDGIRSVWHCWEKGNLINDSPAVVLAVEQPESRLAREVMAHAALMSGIALANSGLGMAHGVAAALGVHCRVPHGLACAVMLPISMLANEGHAKPQMTMIVRHSARVGTGAKEVIARQVELAVDEIRRINERIGIPSRLGDIGVTEDQIPAIVQSSRGNSMNGNPREIDDEELAAILTANL